MGFPTVTYTFANASTADATQVNQNFTDLINGASDGTKNYNISALTAGGASVLNGAVTLGASTSNLIVFNGAVNSDIPINTNTTYSIGAATKGLLGVYIGGSSTFTVRLLGGTQAASYSLTLPTAVPGGSKYIVESDTSGVLSFSSRTDLSVVSKTTTYVATRADDVILCSGSAFTVTLPAASGSMKKFVIKKTDSSLTNIITVARAGSDTIDGATSTTLNTQYESVIIVSDGTSVWNILDRNYPTNEVAYTPTITGFGTASSVSFISRRAGDRLQVRGYFTSGSSTGVQARVSLGFNGTDSNVTVDNTKVSAKSLCGFFTISSAGALSGCVLCTGGQGYITLGYQAAGSGGLTEQNGSSLIGSGQAAAFFFEVPISGWN